MDGPLLGHHRKKVVIISERVPDDVRIVPAGSIRLRVNVVRDVVELDRSKPNGNVGLLVLDAAIPSRPGGFDAQDAARWVVSRVDRQLPVLLWLDKTPSSRHMAEAASLEFAGQEH